MMPFTLKPTHAKLVVGSTDTLPSVEIPMTYAIDDPIRIAIEVANRTGEIIRVPACFAPVTIPLVQNPWLETDGKTVAIHAGYGSSLERNLKTFLAGYYTAHQNKHYPYLYDTFAVKPVDANGKMRWGLIAASNGIPKGELVIEKTTEQMRVRFSDGDKTLTCATYERGDDNIFVQKNNRGNRW